VKSLLGERCDALAFDERGAEGDRRFAIRHANGKLGSGKTTRRFQRIDGLFRFGAELRGGVTEIVFPDGTRRSGNEPGVDSALSAWLGQEVALVPEGDVSHFDAGPVHLVTTTGLRKLAALLPGTQVDARRFRPNLVLDVGDDVPAEEDWGSAILRVGPEVRLRITEPTERCAMVSFAQATLPADPRILRTIATRADLCFGVYAEVVTSGTVAVGDAVVFEDVPA
jgi:uncharacterized protein